jgi:hypothetical protein
MTSTVPGMAHVQGEPFVQQSGRALVGWLRDDDEAIQALLGRGPMPTDDLQPIRDRITQCRAAVDMRQPYQMVNPFVDPGENQAALDAIAARPQLQATFASHQWRVCMVNLTEVLAYQKVIKTDGLEHRLAPVVEDGSRLYEFCLPTEQPPPPQGALVDSDQKGFTVSSLNPNLRIAGGHLTNVQVSPGPGQPARPMQGIVMLVYMGSSYVNVASYRDRIFLRDGYHRTAGLLRAGITIAPCVHIEARSFEELLGRPWAPGLFTYETLYGDRPPRLADFWDEQVASDVKQVATRKVIRVRGEEFVVQV